MPDSIIKADNISSLSGGGIGFPDGSVSNPSLKFTNDGDTGLYRIGSNTIGIASNGSRVGEIGNGYGGFTGNVIQVQSTTLTSITQTGSNSTLQNVTGLSVNITPRYLTSRILVDYIVHYGNTSNGNVVTGLTRNGTSIATSETGGGGQGGSTSSTQRPGSGDTGAITNTGMRFLDSPNSVSLLTYQVTIASQSGTGSYSINRTWEDNVTTGFARPRGISTITVMEIMQ